MKVLFIGNSHTFFNDMPALFAQFIQATTGEKPEVTMLAYGGRDYQWHRKEYFPVRFALMSPLVDVMKLKSSPISPVPKISSSDREIPRRAFAAFTASMHRRICSAALT